jgi:hypothetical protein
MSSELAQIERRLAELEDRLGLVNLWISRHVATSGTNATARTSLHGLQNETTHVYV